MKNYLIILVFLNSILSGCGYFVTKDEFIILQRQTSKIEKDLKATSTYLTTETGELRSVTTRLDDLHERLRTSFADTNVRIDELDFTLSKTRGDFENYKLEVRESFKNVENVFRMQGEFLQKTNAQLLNLSKEIDELKKEFVSFKNITSDISILKDKINEIVKKQEEQLKFQAKIETKSKQQIYDEALGLYNKGDYDKAIENFEQFVIVYPQDALTDNALYWIGESYYALKKYNDALTYFHRIVVDFPNADKVPSALYKVALSLENLGMQKEAEGALRELIARFPNTEEAKEARKRTRKR